MPDCDISVFVPKKSFKLAFVKKKGCGLCGFAPYFFAARLRSGGSRH